MVTRFIARRLEDAALLSIRYPRVLQISRTAFATLAGLAATLRPLPVAAAQACCTGPNGTGWCGHPYCNGAGCSSYAGCDYVTGWCPGGGACWSSWWCSGIVCCDCYCHGWEGGSFYCYCAA